MREEEVTAVRDDYLVISLQLDYSCTGLDCLNATKYTTLALSFALVSTKPDNHHLFCCPTVAKEPEKK